MRHGTATWLGIVALCIVATAYETPNVMRIWRHTVNTYLRRKPVLAEGESLPGRVAALDPEAADILSYASMNNRGDNKARLAKLSTKYPDNEFFLCRRAKALGARGDDDTQTALALADRLLTLNPNNAHYRYLRGWLLLAGPQSNERVEEAFAEFKRGHHLLEFCLPYYKYKERVDRLFNAATLPEWERPRISPFYWRVQEYLSRWPRTRPTLGVDDAGRLIDSAGIMADRLIETAHDLPELSCPASLLDDAEALRLRTFELSPAQAQRTRRRLAQAVALQDVWQRAFDHQSDVFVSAIALGGPGGLLLAVLGEPLFGIFDRRRKRTQTRRSRRAYKLLFANLLGMVAALALVVLLSDVWGSAEFLRPLAYDFTWLLWWGQIGLLATIAPRDLSRGSQPELWLTVAYGFLWLTGVLLLLAGGVALGLPENVDVPPLAPRVLVVWSVLCLLFWVLAGQRGPLFGRVPRLRGLLLVMCWAAALMIVHVGGANLQRVERITDDPLLLCGPLPGATEETYVRYIGSGTPRRYGPEALERLPKYLEYAAPKDMETYFAWRRAQGRPVTRDELRWLRGRCGHDVRPIIQEALHGSEG